MLKSKISILLNFNSTKFSSYILIFSTYAYTGRIEAAKYLLSKNAPSAVYDDQGVSCLSIMVQKMPGVAFLALQQFYAEDPANRKRYCYLNYLEKKLLPDEEVSDVHG